MQDVNTIDKNKLKQLALKGASLEELLLELDIEDATALGAALLELLRSEEAPDKEDEMGMVKRYAMNPTYGPEGIRITPEMLTDTEFKEGDEFGLTTEGDRIILDRSSVGSVGPL